MIHCLCPHCEFQYRLRDDLAGRRANCKNCKKVFRVPVPDDDAPALEAEPASTPPPPTVPDRMASFTSSLPQPIPSPAPAWDQFGDDSPLIERTDSRAAALQPDFLESPRLRPWEFDALQGYSLIQQVRQFAYLAWVLLALNLLCRFTPGYLEQINRMAGFGALILVIDMVVLFGLLAISIVAYCRPNVWTIVGFAIASLLNVGLITLIMAIGLFSLIPQTTRLRRRLSVDEFRAVKRKIQQINAGNAPEWRPCYSIRMLGIKERGWYLRLFENAAVILFPRGMAPHTRVDRSRAGRIPMQERAGPMFELSGIPAEGRSPSRIGFSEAVAREWRSWAKDGDERVPS